LVVDDEKLIRELLEDFLGLEGFQVTTAEGGEQALEMLSQENFDLVLTDLKMPKMSGLQLLSQAKQLKPSLVVIIMTGYGTLDTAIDSMKQGAYDYLLKPFKVEDVLRIVSRGLRQGRLEKENINLKQTLHIYDASEAISSTLELDAIYAYALKAVDALLDPDYAALYLKNEKSGHYDISLEFLGEQGEELKGMRGQLSANELLKFFDQHKPCLLYDREIAKAYLEQPATTPLVSFTAFPIRAKEEISGFIVAVSFNRNKIFEEGQRRAMTIIANRIAFAIENAILYENLQNLFYQTVEGFARAIEAKDKYTHGHSERVCRLATIIAEGMDLPEVEVKLISQAAILHDIGKLSLDLSMLNFPGKLDRDGINTFREHPKVGMDILQPIYSLGKIVPYIYHHHENFDGSGYPDKLKGEDIPLGARILAVADSYDAMTSQRAYRKPRNHAAAIEELIRCAGKQFDPQVVKVFMIQIEKDLPVRPRQKGAAKK